MKYIEKIIDVQTGNEELKPYSDEQIKESKDLEARQIENAERQENLKALKASAKAKLISGQPLTEDEADTLVI